MTYTQNAAQGACPLIGICGSVDKDESRQFILRDYMRVVAEAGGAPLLLSMDMTAAELAACAARLDGLLLAGGGDIAPALYGQAPIAQLGEVSALRDEAETAMLKAFLPTRKPLLGICRGIQMLNVALGGTLYQDLGVQYRQPNGLPPLNHQQAEPYSQPCHRVTLEPASLLSRLLGETTLTVNSMHHQAVWALAPGCAVVARGEDGVIEAVELAELPFGLAVQWHPERLRDEASRRLFAAFVGAAAGEGDEGRGTRDSKRVGIYWQTKRVRDGAHPLLFMPLGS